MTSVSARLHLWPEASERVTLTVRAPGAGAAVEAHYHGRRCSALHRLGRGRSDGTKGRGSVPDYEFAPAPTAVPSTAPVRLEPDVVVRQSGMVPVLYRMRLRLHEHAGQCEARLAAADRAHAARSQTPPPPPPPPPQLHPHLAALNGTLIRVTGGMPGLGDLFLADSPTNLDKNFVGLVSGANVPGGRKKEHAARMEDETTLGEAPGCPIVSGQVQWSFEPVARWQGRSWTATGRFQQALEDARTSADQAAALAYESAHTSILQSGGGPEAAADAASAEAAAAALTAVTGSAAGATSLSALLAAGGFGTTEAEREDLAARHNAGEDLRAGFNAAPPMFEPPSNASVRRVLDVANMQQLSASLRTSAASAPPGRGRDSLCVQAERAAVNVAKRTLGMSGTLADARGGRSRTPRCEHSTVLAGVRAAPSGSAEVRSAAPLAHHAFSGDSVAERARKADASGYAWMHAYGVAPRRSGRRPALTRTPWRMRLAVPYRLVWSERSAGGVASRRVTELSFEFFCEKTSTFLQKVNCERGSRERARSDKADHGRCRIF